MQALGSRTVTLLRNRRLTGLRHTALQGDCEGHTQRHPWFRVDEPYLWITIEPPWMAVVGSSVSDAPSWLS